MNTVLSDDDVLVYDLLDEAIEAAGGLTSGVEDTTNCTWSVTTECTGCAW